MGSTYEEHRRRSEAAYLVAYEEFERGLSDSAREALGNAAVPDLEEHKTMNTRRTIIGDRDVADLAWVDWREIEENPVDIWMERLPSLTLAEAQKLQEIHEALVNSEAEERRAADLVQLVATFLDSSNVRLQAAALAFAAGLPVVSGARTMTEWAAAHGVTKAALSKIARQWQRRLNLPPGPHLKEIELCRKYSKSQNEGHWRRRTNEE